MEAIRSGQSLRSRRYRNRRLGEFLKELELTEGRATGIPTIQDELRDNGSPQATNETDEERSHFLIDIPCHPDFITYQVVLHKDFTIDDPKDGPKGETKKVSDRQGFILLLIKDNDLITIQEISQKIKVSEKNVKRELAVLQEKGILTREGFELEDASLASILASFSSSGDL